MKKTPARASKKTSKKPTKFGWLHRIRFPSSTKGRLITFAAAFALIGAVSAVISFASVPGDPQLVKWEAQFRDIFFPGGQYDDLSINFIPGVMETSNGSTDGYYYATTFHFANTGNCASYATTCYHGYMGAQTNLSGNRGKGFIFSLWNTTQAVAAPGGIAQAFGGEGAGMQILYPFDFKNIPFTYSFTLKLSRVSTNPANPDYNWWQMNVVYGDNNNVYKTLYIGKINNGTNRGGVRADNGVMPDGGRFKVQIFQERYFGSNYVAGNNTPWTDAFPADCSDQMSSAGTFNDPRLGGIMSTSASSVRNYGSQNPCLFQMYGVTGGDTKGYGTNFSMGRSRFDTTPNYVVSGGMKITTSTPGTLTFFPCRERITSSKKKVYSYSNGSSVNFSAQADSEGGLCWYGTTGFSYTPTAWSIQPPLSNQTNPGPTTPPPTTPPTTPPSTPGSPVISSFTASPSTVAYKGSTNLSWTVSGAINCSLTYYAGTVTVATSGGISIQALTQSTTFTLTCVNNSGSASKQTSVTVSGSSTTPPPTTPPPTTPPPTTPPPTTPPASGGTVFSQLPFANNSTFNLYDSVAVKPVTVSSGYTPVMVRFLIDGVVKKTDYTQPYCLSSDSGSSACASWRPYSMTTTGTHTMTVRMYDENGYNYDQKLTFVVR